ncbi:MAG: hypothetical protein ACUVWP_05035 [bacterium]
MRKFIIVLLLLISISLIYSNFEKDMIYHTEPTYVWAGPSNIALACYFKLTDFDISGYNYKIKIIGFIGKDYDGKADIYVTSKEEWNDRIKCYVPVCNPDNNWKGKDYGPKSWHINNTYPNYDDCNLYNDNWLYSKDIDKFWCIYFMRYSPPVKPFSDGYSSIINSLTWYDGDWSKGVYYNKNYNWCMHCVIVYWPDVIENTSLGAVKALFR